MKHISLDIFAERLRKLRNEKGLSTRALGEIIGVSNATISRYETGKRDPDLLVVNKIANYFNVTIEYLCGEDINGDLDDLINIYNKLSDIAKKESLRYITYLYEKEKEQ